MDEDRNKEYTEHKKCRKSKSGIVKCENCNRYEECTGYKKRLSETKNYTKQEFRSGMENLKASEKAHRRKVIVSVVKILLLIFIICGIPLYLYFFHLDFLKGFKDVDTIVAFLNRHKSRSVLIYIAFQIIQIVISVIPGQVVQMAAGYLFGFWQALLYALGGAVLGTSLSFGLAKLLGRDFLHIFFGEEKMSYYIERLNSKQAYTIVFFLYLIPGLPKDMVSYAAGASEMRFKPFILLSAVGRLPGMIGCLLMGTLAETENFVGVGIIGGIALIACILCLVFRKKINAKLDSIYEKLSK